MQRCCFFECENTAESSRSGSLNECLDFQPVAYIHTANARLFERLRGRETAIRDGRSETRTRSSLIFNDPSRPTKRSSDTNPEVFRLHFRSDRELEHRRDVNVNLMVFMLLILFAVC